MRAAAMVGVLAVAAGCVIPDQPSSGCDLCHPCVLPGEVCVSGQCVAGASADAGSDAGIFGTDSGFLPGEFGPPDPAEVDGTLPHSIAAASDGTNFLLAWADIRDGGSAVHFERFDPSGQALSPGEVALSATGSRPRGVCATFDGRDFFVAWDDGSGAARQLYGARVSPVGYLLDGPGTPLAPTAADQLHPACAAGASQLLVVWTDYRSDSGAQLFGARFDLDGGHLDGSGFPLSTKVGLDFAAVASDGANYLVAWADPTVAAFPLIRGTRVTAAGQPLDAADGGLPLGTRCAAEALPAIGVYAGEYSVVWEDHCTSSPRIFTDRVYGDGGLVDQPNYQLSTTGAAFAPAVTSAGGQYLYAWANALTPGPSDIDFNWYLNTPDAGFDHHQGFFVAQTPQDEQNAVIATNSRTTILVGYASHLATMPWRVRARLINAVDAGASDAGGAGTPADAGNCDGVPPPPSPGCGSVAGAGLFGALFGSLALLRRRRAR